MTNEAPGNAADAAWRDTIGREAQRRAARATLDDRRLLVVSGVPGIGKSAFLDALAAELQLDGADVVQLRATVSSRDVPLGVFASLLAEVPAHGEPVELARDVLLALAWRADARPLVVVVDDVHLLDAQSSTVVHQLASNDAVAVVLAYRIGARLPDGIEVLRAGATAHEIRLEALEPDEANALVAAVAGDRLSRADVDEICRVSDGVPLFLVTVTRDRVERSATARASSVGPGLRAAVEGRLGRLDPGEREVLEYIALAEPLEVKVAELLAPTELLAGLEERRLVVVDEARRRTAIRMAHPLFGEVLRADMPLLRKRSHLRALVEARAAVAPDRRRHDVLRRVLWQLDGGADVAPGDLARAAGAAASFGGVDVALRLARLARERDTDDDTACLLAMALLSAGHMAELDAFCASLPMPAEDSQRTQIAVTWAIAAFAGLGDAARAAEIIERFRPLVGDAGRYELDSIDVMARFYAGDIASALAVGERVLTAPDLTDRARLNTLLPTVLALGTGGRTIEAVHLGERAVALAPAHAAEVAMAETSALCVWGHAVAWSGEPAACTATLEQRRHEASASLDHASAEVLGVTLGIARMVEGRFSLAAALFDGLRPSASLFALAWQPYAVAWRALSLARLGRVDDARLVVAPLVNGGGNAAHRGFLALAMAEIDASSKGRGVAAGHLEVAAARADERGQALIALLVTFRALTLDASDERATAALEAVHHHDGRLSSHMGGAIDGWCRRSVPSLLDVARTAERDGLGMLALEVWDLIDATAVAARLPSAERDRLRVRHVETRHRLGVGDVGLAVPTSGGLTEREATIARLAAAGWQDKDIASQLDLSVRTVNAHLRTVYLKLGIRGRAGLRSEPSLASGALPPSPPPPG